MCLMHRTTEKDPRQVSPLSAQMGRATERDWPKRPSDHQLQEACKKDSDRAITPGAEAVHVPAYLVPLGSLQASSCFTFTPNSHWGRDAHSKNCLASMHAGSLRVCLTLCDPVDCVLPGFCVREGASPGKKTGAYCALLVVIPF